MRAAVETTGRALPLPVLCNMGGPMSRRRSQRLESTVLGERHRYVRCPRVRQLALDFGDADPLRAVETLLGECGFRDVREAEQALLPAIAPSLCRMAPELEPLPLAKAEPLSFLRQALLLGHCTVSFFDLARPLLWTRASLTRRLELFEGKGFYA